MRIILFTGKGGVGKSTVASGTAALAASQGHRTLVLSTDGAHSLAETFGAPVGAEPSQVADNLYVQQVDAQLRFEQSWAEIQGYLLSVLDVAGVDSLAAEELTVIPGAEEVLALLELRLHALSDEWDLVVVDCAPTAETLRLLALPEALGWYMQRVFPMQQRVVKALRPVLNRAAGVPMPGGNVFGAIERLHAELDEVRSLLSGPEASVRIVLTPESVVLAEARRSYTTLSLYGYRVDGVVANRVFPAKDADDWRAGWVLAQDDVLEQVEQSFAGLPLWRSEYGAMEPVGVEALTALAQALYGDDDPVATTRVKSPFEVVTVSGGVQMGLRLPFVSRDQVDLARSGDELVVTVGQYRRLLTLPAGLAKLRVAGARVDEDGVLRVRFEDPTPKAAPKMRKREGDVSQQGPGTEGPDDIGSVAEEATKLLGAVADWAREHGSELGAGVAALADQAAASAHDLNAHIATDDPECRYCPVCRTVHAVRSASPEVRDSVTAAASSFLQAAAGLLAAGSGGGRDGKPPVQRIDLDEDSP